MESEVISKLDSFFGQFKPVIYSPGQRILIPGDKVYTITYIQTGAVKSYSMSEDGDELTIHVFRNPAFFPIMLSLSNKNNTYYYEAIETVKGYSVDQNKVIEFLQNNPDVLLDLTTRFSHAITGLVTRLESLSFQNAYRKIISLFIYLSDKFGQQTAEGIRISLALNHQDIASWVGIRRETASRQIEILQKKQIISSAHQHFIIVRPDQLQKELEQTHVI